MMAFIRHMRRYAVSAGRSDSRNPWKAGGSVNMLTRQFAFPLYQTKGEKL